MKEINISSTADLLTALNSLPNSFIYRGQANAAWGLESSLERIIGGKWSAVEATRFEDFSIAQFRSKFHLYDRENLQPSSKLGWLSVMQHHGVPTRLLDFTESPYVALYFALESYQPQSKNDLAIFAIDYSATMDSSIAHISSRDSAFTENRTTLSEKQDKIFEDIVDRFSYEIAWVTEPKLCNTRLDKQAGCFIISGNKSSRISNILNSEAYKDVPMFKFIIKSELYEGIFALLRKMNITSKSLYGDLDGLARAIRMQMQVYSA